MNSSFRLFLLLASVATMPAVATAQFECTTNNDTITIAKYTGAGGAVNIPDKINGLAVARIGGT